MRADGECTVRALDAGSLQAVGVFADAGGIDKAHAHAVDRDRLLDRVARRACDLRDERAILAEQRVEQRRLPGVGRPNDRDGDALAHEPSHFTVTLQAQQFCDNRVEFRAHVRAIGIGHFLGKIDGTTARFDDRRPDVHAAH